MPIQISKLGKPPHVPELKQQGEQLWEQLQTALAAANQPLPNQQWQTLLPQLFCCSPFIAKTVIAQPQWLSEILNTITTTNPDSHAGQALDPNVDIAQAMMLLRQLRQKIMVQIALKDLLGLVDLSQTLVALSALADYCIQQAAIIAYRQLRERYGEPVNTAGEPQSLIILAMGKLGGQELNYSSDIDLVFAYPQHGQTRSQQDVPAQRSIDNQAFFTQQAQLIIKLLHETTADGFVFRVDTRLRPFGDSGALVVSFDFIESYYQNQGRDWERYAFIKARPVSGAAKHIAELDAILKPFVYRRYLDYGAFQALREMKALITQQVASKGLKDNIKLGPGGIREIEFIVQTFQLIRGGQESALQRRELKPVLNYLGQRGLLEPELAAQLYDAYRFLRDVENRLQMVADQQTHQLPKDRLEQERLAYAMDCADYTAFSTALAEARSVVSHAFDGIFFGESQNTITQTGNPQWLDILQGRLAVEEIWQELAALGFTDNQQLAQAVSKFSRHHSVRHMSQIARQRLTQLLPNILPLIASSENPERTLDRVLTVLLSIVQRSVYIALLLEYPMASKQLVALCAASPWVTDLLAQQPILLDSLWDDRLLHDLPTRAELAQQLSNAIALVDNADPEQQLNVLRHFKQEQVLRVAAIDVRGDLPLMRVSDQLTWLGEAILLQVHGMASQTMLDSYGLPYCRSENHGQADIELTPELAVIAYGKLGGIELGYGSDLDLVFLHNSQGQQQYTQGDRRVENQLFFTRLAQRLMHLLSTQTLSGVLYEIDTRLRPDGIAGPMVSSLKRFADYQQQHAWTWEHQALVRARIVVGGTAITTAFNKIRHDILTQQRDRQRLRNDVCDMRMRMQQKLDKGKGKQFDLKQSRGGIADIEFIVQYGVLAWAHDYSELTKFTDNIRILEQFGVLGLLEQTQAEQLMEAYRQLRAIAHQRALQMQPALLHDSTPLQPHIDAVVAVWSAWMHADAGGNV